MFLSSHLCMFALQPEPAPRCSTSAPAPAPVSAGLPGSLRRPRTCRCRAALWETPGWGSPSSRWPAACGAPPAPPWRAAARWWGCISRRCSPWSGSSACDLWATRARRGSCTARTWGSSAAGPGAETPGPPCRGRETRTRSFCQTVRVSEAVKRSRMELLCLTHDTKRRRRERRRGVGFVEQDPPFLRLTAQIRIRLTRAYGDE